jgi:hypothetical protein
MRNVVKQIHSPEGAMVGGGFPASFSSARDFDSNITTTQHIGAHHNLLERSIQP